MRGRFEKGSPAGAWFCHLPPLNVYVHVGLYCRLKSLSSGHAKRAAPVFRTRAQVDNRTPVLPSGELFYTVGTRVMAIGVDCQRRDEACACAQSSGFQADWVL